MRFRNSFHLLLNNFKNTYVILLFRVVILLLTGSLVAVILASGAGLVTDSAEWGEFITSIKDVFATFFNSSDYESFDVLFREAMENVVISFGEVLRFLRSHVAEVVLSSIALVLLYLVERFLNGLALFGFGNILNDKMSEYAETPFFAGFLHNVGSAALYQIVYVPIAFAYDFVSVILCYVIFFRLFFFLPVLVSLFFGVIFLISMQAIKLSLISDWMPAIIVDGKSFGRAMKESFHMGKKRFGIYFSNYLMAIFCILAVNVLFAAASFFSALLITIPASFAFLICLQFVNYYTANNKKFFISFTEIYDPATPENGCAFTSRVGSRQESVEGDENNADER